MASFLQPNFVADTSTAQSGSTITLSGTGVTGFRTFNTGVGNGVYTDYTVFDTAGNRETSYGVYTHSGLTLGRLSTPISSTNGGAQVAAFSGTVTVIVAPEGSMMSAALGNNLGGLNSIAGAQRYWGPDYTGFTSAAANSAKNAGFTYFVPIYIGQWFTTLSLRVNIGTLASGTSTTTLGLYSHSGGGPLTLLGTGAATIISGNQGGGTTGEQSVSITLTATPLPPGLYWAGVALATTNASFYSGGSLTTNPRVAGWNTIVASGAFGGYFVNSTTHANVTQSGLSLSAGATIVVLASPGL